MEQATTKSGGIGCRRQTSLLDMFPLLRGLSMAIIEALVQNLAVFLSIA
jgi:hypothetical protein